jgi:hypothetical protein
VVVPISQRIRFGFLASGNWKSYEASNAQSSQYYLQKFEPAKGYAFQIGGGLSSQRSGFHGGIDLIFEPAFVNYLQSSSWINGRPSDDLNPIPLSRSFTRSSTSLQFSNWIGRAGFRSSEESVSLSIGLQLRAVRLRSQNKASTEYPVGAIPPTSVSSDVRSGWNEWRLSVGLSFNTILGDFEYAGILTKLRPLGESQFGGFAPASISRQSFIDITSGSLSTKYDESVLHRIQYSVHLL